MDNRIREFAERYTAAWCSGDPEAVSAHFAANGALTINDGEPSAGRAAVTAVAHAFMATFPDMQLELMDLREEDDRVVYHWRLTGTNSGLEGVAGNVVVIEGCERWQFSPDGLIQDSQGSFDALDYARQLGNG